MNRTKARTTAFEILFQIDFNEIEPRKAITNHLDTLKIDEFLHNIVEGVIANKDKIDGIITNHLTNWSIDRIASVEKTILRIAAYEINFLDDIPIGVSINEAVELGNLYGDEKSGKFINGVLSKMLK